MTWQERIDRARTTGAFTEEDKDLATSFTTCAVGERLGLGLRDCLPGGEENSLWYLGLDFCDEVVHDRVERVAELYQKIHEVPEEEAR